jgi:hypothetical protein
MSEAVKQPRWWYVNERGGITYSWSRESLTSWRDGNRSRFGPGADCYEDEDGDLFDSEHFIGPPPSSPSPDDEVMRAVKAHLAQQAENCRIVARELRTADTKEKWRHAAQMIEGCAEGLDLAISTARRTASAKDGVE